MYHSELRRGRTGVWGPSRNHGTQRELQPNLTRFLSINDTSPRSCSNTVFCDGSSLAGASSLSKFFLAVRERVQGPSGAFWTLTVFSWKSPAFEARAASVGVLP